MADDKMKAEQDFGKQNSGSTTSPLQAKPASGLVSYPHFYLRGARSITTLFPFRNLTTV